ncbi:macro domain-containing protein [Paraburkholderia sp. BL21I4N1]|uniref:type II toxin-antitoxin system antitoxin DNA ADP-ribosyl glycohydrolase DarG n=1 Tax=Paraburkholderia sp. BL21I4N1 TaxID=1938801 RepID=UPI000CFB0A71|nr:macro domain-containing protein [Paraburkholderia sp. BL21I4N1]PQV45150.1 O-acetyl-ADP-ribose deacetylase (regulator of RNase III) [Paraburkholderia sp. BL21I4N1]
MFKALIGDMFTSDAQVLVNTVNCVGVMGKGVAQEFKRRFPAMFEDYKARCDRHQVRIGEPYLYRDLSGLLVLNFPTKDHWRSPSRLADIEQGLDYLTQHLEEWGIRSMAMPPLGCGNGGLEWSEVGPLIYRKLSALPVDVELYAPYGTPKSEVGTDFLQAPTQLSLEGKGRKADAFRPEWAVLMEILRELQLQPYANPVGRTIFQKICYVATEMGIPTGFAFEKGSYGPFSNDVGRALHVFANKNWLKEERLGRMIAMRVTPQFERESRSYSEYISANQKKIRKAVDLFSRIKSTEQAEEVLTVLFASRQMKQSRPNAELDEQQLFDFVLGWKKSWQTEEKKEAVASAIRNLVILGWMKVTPSESFMVTA